MKSVFWLSLLACLFHAAFAHAETKVGAEIFANFRMDLDAGGNGTGNYTKVQGFDVPRARVNVVEKFNDTWNAKIEIDKTATATTLVKAYIWGNKVFTDTDTLKFGKVKNEYIEYTDMYIPTWITKNASGVLQDATNVTAYDDTKGRITYDKGLIWSNSFSDSFTAAFLVNNGDGAVDTNLGYGVVLSYKPLENFHFVASYQASDKGKAAGALDAGPDTIDGMEYIDLLAAYTSDILDATLEYSHANDNRAPGAVSIDQEPVSDYAVSLNYKYAENKAIYAYYLMGDSKLKDFNGFKSRLIAGPTWVLTKGIQTGVFYQADENENSDKSTSAIYWKWVAKF